MSQSSPASVTRRPPAPRAVDLPPRSTIPHFVIDLDLPPSQRWSDVIAVYAPYWQTMVDAMWKEFEELHGEQFEMHQEDTLAQGGGELSKKKASKKVPKLSAAAKHAEHVAFGTQLADQMTSAFRSHGLGAYAEELESVAKLARITLAELVLLNLSYEAHGGCTTILAPTEDGKVIMGRTLDWQQPLLKHLTIELSFYRGGQLIYRATSFAGFLGIFTGHVPGQYAVAVNFRCADDVAEDSDESEADEAAHEDAAMQDSESTPEFSWPVGFLVRHTLESCLDYSSALDRLHRCTLMSQVYFILCGRKPTEACVITRNPENSVQPVKMAAAVPESRRENQQQHESKDEEEQFAASARSKLSQRTSHQAFTVPAVASNSATAASSVSAAASSSSFYSSAISACPSSRVPAFSASSLPWLVQANLDHWVTRHGLDHQESLPRTKLVHAAMKSMREQGLPANELRMWQMLGLDPIWDGETIYATVSIPADDRFVTLVDNPHPPPKSKAKTVQGTKRNRRR